VWYLDEISGSIKDKCTLNQAGPGGRIVA
jgi:hypothetical protein